MHKSKILEMELMLCSKMLQRDERNFHCWNYRLWVTELYVKEIGKRADSSIARSKQKEFIQAECDMAHQIIERNFSNYSAWHYRGKLKPLIHTDDEGGVYAIPLEQIKDDLKRLKHAFFTDPKDQSPWNYHEWLISLVSPIQVVALRFLNTVESAEDYAAIVVGLSHQVKSFAALDVDLVDENGDSIDFMICSSNSRQKKISSSWELRFNKTVLDTHKLLTLSVRVPDPKGKNLAEIDTAETTNGLKVFRNFFTHIKFTNNDGSIQALYELGETAVWPNANPILTELHIIAVQELANIRELTEFEEGLEFALLRQLEILRL